MNLSIIIPTKDRGIVFEQTLRCAIEAIGYSDAEIVVVNDSKTTQPAIPNIEKVKLVNNPKAGVASARNFGVKNAAGKILLFLDDDIIVSKASIDHILQLHEQYLNACFNLNWVYPPELEAQLQNTSFGRFMLTHELNHFRGWYSDVSWKDNALFSSKAVASFHLSVSKDNFIKSGGYNENFAEAGFEDYDFPLRLKKISISFFIDTRIHVFHNEEDMITLESWLIRQQRGAFTRKEAVSLGYTELELHYGFFKIIAFSAISVFRPVLLIIFKGLAHKISFDALSFRLILLLQAQSIYRGYSHKVLHK